MALQQQKPEITEDQMKKLREVFEILDDDNSGEMNSQELFNAMKYLGLKMTQEEVEKMLEEFDDDGSGLIEFEEFMALINKMGLHIHSSDIMVVKTLVRSGTTMG
eukprot:TRINITY_DN19793_c0_g1_i1.p2 TRINITY_DN19793_c0_g1~~TRINITY_DN19793_c0_g1_i1.p2  ORF type:complete len:105 (-),score=47.38 TRINITY_DN19793_c0_g1_i1:179-493(-)